MNATKWKWVRLKNRSRELRGLDGGEDMIHAIVEPACARGNYWWTTWGNAPDVGGYAFCLRDALRLAEYHARAAELRWRDHASRAKGDQP